MSSPQQPYGPPPQFPPPAQAPGVEPYPGASSYAGPAAPGWGGHPHPGAGAPGTGGPPYGGDQGGSGYPYPGPVAQMPEGYAYAGPQQYGQPYPGPYGAPPPAPKRGVPVWAWISGAIALVATVVVLLVVFTDGAPSRSGTGAPAAAPRAPEVTAAPRAAEPAAPSGNRPVPGGSGGGTAGAASAGFGQPVTTPDGLTIEVSAPVPFTPSEYAAGNDRERSIKITTTVTNGGSEPYELNGLLLGPRGTHAGQEAEEILDFGNDVSLPPLETVQPGASLSYEVALSIGGQPSELRLVFSPDYFDGEEIVIAGEV